MDSISYQAVFNEKPNSSKLEEMLEKSIEQYLEELKFEINVNYCRKITDEKKYIVGFDVVLDTDSEEPVDDEDSDSIDDGEVSEYTNFFDSPLDFETDYELDIILKTFKGNLDEIEAEAVFKFCDDNLYKKLSLFYEKIFEIEMRLREVFTFIFVDTYKADYYNLLKEIKMGDESTFISEEDKKNLPEKLENEFFHMSFSMYKKMGHTKEVISIEEDLIPIIDVSTDLDEFKTKIENRGIVKARYNEFFAEINEHLKNLEDLRNCVAHNRTPTDDEIYNYTISSKKLEISIKTFWEELN